jgi:hypothetical protein
VPPALPRPAVQADAIGAELARLRETARTSGEALWPGYGSAPFGFLLVGQSQEVLLCQPAPPPGFAPAGRDEAVGCDRFVRPRTGLPEGLLAAMPLFGPPSTIVMGTRESTGLTVLRWRATLLHEHFHQWQTALPGYFARVAALDLAGGDQSGMWMLNFPFPYADPTIGAAYYQAAQALADALEARRTGHFAAKVAAYVERRRAFAAASGERNWRYLEFQLWQEGVARWTEIALGRNSDDWATRMDAAAREEEVIGSLRHPELSRQGRLAAYAIGAGEAMLLEACGPGWRARYPTLLAMGPMVEEAATSCGRPATAATQ